MLRLLSLMLVVLFSSPALANYIGSEVQYFNPTPDNMDFFTVHSARTLPKGTVKTTLFFDYAENIHYSSPTLENNVAQAQLGFGMGVTDRLSFSFAGSALVNYDAHTGGEYTTDNITHVRTSLKYRFCDCEDGGMALVFNLGFGLMESNYFVGDDNDFGASLLLAYDKKMTDTVRFGANLGYRYRNSEETLVAAPAGYFNLPEARDGSDLLVSFGLNFLLNDRLTGVTELYMSLPTDQLFDFTVDPTETFDQKGAEFLLGANYSLTDRIDLGFGGTLGIFSEAQNADWRAFLGLSYAFGNGSDEAAFNYTGTSSAPRPKAKKALEAIKQEVRIEDAPVLKEFNVTAKFPSGTAALTNQAKAQLSEAGEFLKANAFRMIFVEGHTDSRGADSFNKMLSQRRAQMVKAYMVRTYGLPADKVQAIGFGETSPIADNSTLEGRSKNRRVVIKIK